MEYSWGGGGGGGGGGREGKIDISLMWYWTRVLLTPTSRKNHVNLKCNYKGSTEHQL